MMPRLMRYKEVARQLGVCVKTVRRMVDAGELPKPVKVAGAVALVESEVAAYLQRIMDNRQTA